MLLFYCLLYVFRLQHEFFFRFLFHLVLLLFFFISHVRFQQTTKDTIYGPDYLNTTLHSWKLNCLNIYRWKHIFWKL